MLTSSPRIYIPPESDFIPRFFTTDPKEHLDPDCVARLLEIIFDKYRFGKEWQGERPNPDVFSSRMEEPTPAAFLDTLYRMYAAQRGSIRWGDKTPIYTSYIPLIHRIFPSAQFIHMIRDGRDVALSTLDKWGESEVHVDIYYAARIWVRRIHQARWAARALASDQYLEVRYEDLVQSPEMELRTICRFLEEPFDPKMAKYHHQARRLVAPGDFHAPVRHPPDPSRAGRWRREMSKNDRRIYEHVAGPLLEALGYGVEDLGPLSAAQRLRLLALQCKYDTLQASRQLAQRLGLVPPIYGQPAPADARGGRH